MGAWGLGLFENDRDLDSIGNLFHKLGLHWEEGNGSELYNALRDTPRYFRGEIPKPELSKNCRYEIRKSIRNLGGVNKLIYNREEYGWALIALPLYLDYKGNKIKSVLMELYGQEVENILEYSPGTPKETMKYIDTTYNDQVTFWEIFNPGVQERLTELILVGDYIKSIK